MKISQRICFTYLALLALTGCANLKLDMTVSYQTDSVIEAKKQASPYYGVVK